MNPPLIGESHLGPRAGDAGAVGTAGISVQGASAQGSLAKGSLEAPGLGNRVVLSPEVQKALSGRLSAISATTDLSALKKLERPGVPESVPASPAIGSEMTSAVTRLQAVVRGNQARKEVSALRAVRGGVSSAEGSGSGAQLLAGGSHESSESEKSPVHSGPEVSGAASAQVPEPRPAEPLAPPPVAEPNGLQKAFMPIGKTAKATADLSKPLGPKATLPQIQERHQALTAAAAQARTLANQDPSNRALNNHAAELEAERDGVEMRLVSKGGRGQGREGLGGAKPPSAALASKPALDSGSNIAPESFDETKTNLSAALTKGVNPLFRDSHPDSFGALQRMSQSDRLGSAIIASRARAPSVESGASANTENKGTNEAAGRRPDQRIDAKGTILDSKAADALARSALQTYANRPTSAFKQKDERELATVGMRSFLNQPEEPGEDPHLAQQRKAAATLKAKALIAQSVEKEKTEEAERARADAFLENQEGTLEERIAMRVKNIKESRKKNEDEGRAAEDARSTAAQDSEEAQAKRGALRVRLETAQANDAKRAQNREQAKISKRLAALSAPLLLLTDGSPEVGARSPVAGAVNRSADLRAKTLEKQRAAAAGEASSGSAWVTDAQGLLKEPDAGRKGSLVPAPLASSSGPTPTAAAVGVAGAGSLKALQNITERLQQSSAQVPDASRSVEQRVRNSLGLPQHQAAMGQDASAGAGWTQIAIGTYEGRKTSSDGTSRVVAVRMTPGGSGRGDAKLVKDTQRTGADGTLQSKTSIYEADKNGNFFKLHTWTTNLSQIKNLDQKKVEELGPGFYKVSPKEPKLLNTASLREKFGVPTEPSSIEGGGSQGRG